MVDEIWKWIDGFEGLYKVSNFGRVKSYHSHKGERMLKPTRDKDGYLYVGLHRYGAVKTCKVHRLVAAAFIPQVAGFDQINHKDENKENNKWDNLEWCDVRYNNAYGTARARGAAACKGKPNITAMRAVICIDTKKEYPSLKDASIDSGCPVQGICDCCKGRQKTTSGLSWKYKTEGVA